MILKRNTNKDVAIGLDFGNSQTKIVVLTRAEGRLQLLEYITAPSPNGWGKPGTEQQFGADLAALLGKLKTTERNVFAVASCPSATICEAEVPRVPADELASVLRLNSQRYLRRDLTNFYIDACEMAVATADPKAAKKQAGMKLLVAVAAREEVQWCRNALVAASARPESIELPAITVINALQASQPEICEKETVLLLDIGARQTSISIVRNGQPVMNRVMQFGGAHITEYIAQILGLEPAAAEEQKLKFAETAVPLIEAKLFALAREIRTSVDFYERQQENHVTKALACGGTACSPDILRNLSEAVGVTITAWNPVQELINGSPDIDATKLAGIAPCLAAAVGAAAGQLAGN